jgi:hypothetical protein
MAEWTEGICVDGAAILRDGCMVPIEELIATLNGYEARIGDLEGELRGVMHEMDHILYESDTTRRGSRVRYVADNVRTVLKSKFTT